jgi:N6-L-threonylcarbamoyladenine synthase
VPEIASRNHTLAVKSVVDEALVKAGVTLDEIDAVAVTYGSGLVGALLVGVSYAKALAYSAQKPLIPVNHIRGHVSANYVAHEGLEPPYVCLVVSGGHTAILVVKSWTEVEVLGNTVDDACGEAFDKVAKVLGLPYPGGPQIEKLAREGKPTIKLPRPLKKEKNLNFSFSGLKTAVINHVNTAKMKGQEIVPADVACSFQEAAVSFLADNLVSAVRKTGLEKVAVAGGVGANGALRERLTAVMQKEGVELFLPPKSLCTDNAVMIASAGYFDYISGKPLAGLELNADPSLDL